MSDLSVELQSQGKPVAEVQVTNMKAGVTRRQYNTNLAMSDQSLLLVDIVSGSLRGSDPESPGSPGLLSSPPPSQFDISKASLDRSKHVRYGWAGGYSVWVKRYSKALNDAKKDNDFS